MNCCQHVNGQNKLSILLVFLFFTSFSSIADNYSIYLVRHAEKVSDSKNPTLTVCGKKRAKQLATLLSTTLPSTVY